MNNRTESLPDLHRREQVCELVCELGGEWRGAARDEAHAAEVELLHSGVL